MNHPSNNSLIAAKDLLVNEAVNNLANLVTVIDSKIKNDLLQTHIKPLEEQVNALQKAEVSLREELRAEVAKIRKVWIQEKDDTIQELKNKNNDLQQKNTDLTNQVKALEEECNDIKAEATEIQSNLGQNIEQLRRETESQKDELSTLNDQLKQIPKNMRYNLKMYERYRELPEEKRQKIKIIRYDSYENFVLSCQRPENLSALYSWITSACTTENTPPDEEITVFDEIVDFSIRLINLRSGMELSRQKTSVDEEARYSDQCYTIVNDRKSSYIRGGKINRVILNGIMHGTEIFDNKCKSIVEVMEG